MKRPIIVCICGSTKFKDEWEKAIMQETLGGKIVLSVAFYTHADGHVIESRVKEMLDELYLRKIDLADEIFVINKDGYIGESTSREIEYAEANGKLVRYLEKEIQ